MPGEKLLWIGLRPLASETSFPAAPGPAPSYQLVGDISVVLSGHALPNGRLHQPRQGREHVDGGVDLGEQKKGWQKARSKRPFPPCFSAPPPHGFQGTDPHLLYREVGYNHPPVSPTNSRAWVCKCLQVFSQTRWGEER